MRACRFTLTAACFLAPVAAQDSTASISGHVTDTAGVGISGALAELQPDRAPNLTSADSNGEYQLARLPADTYTLKLEAPGFNSLTIKSIRLIEGEHRSLPILQLKVCYPCRCADEAVLDYFRALPSADHVGNVKGRVVIAKARKIRPLVGAELTLICDTGGICGVTRTDSNGEFTFEGIRPGNHSVRVTRPGFFPMTEPGYVIAGGLESIYWPISLDRCPLGNCDPRLRPKKPIAHCE